MKFITKKIHSYLDYPVAISLLVLPFLLGLGDSHPLAFYLSVVIGAAAFILTFLTDHQTKIIKVIPYRYHLIVDFLVAILFIAAPFIFSFEGLDAYFYWIIGVTVLLVVALDTSKKQDTSTVSTSHV